MGCRIVAVLLWSALCAVAAAAEKNGAPAQLEPQQSQQIGRLVQQLNADRAEERDAAEAKLIELAGATNAEADRFLAALPVDNDQMPLAVRDRLSKIRRRVEDRAAKAAVAATTISLSAKDMPLGEVFAAIEKQTGNRFIDNRDRGETAGVAERITIELKDEPFWPAVDRILDQAQAGIYAYGGEDALSVVSRPADEAPRFGRAVYSGPFRIELLEIQAQRNLRQARRESLRLQLEIGWEPRLKPIALSQPGGDIQATLNTGRQLSVAQPEAVLDVEIPGGTQAAEITLPFELPPREARQIATLRGKLLALVPGRHVKFRFSDLAKAAGKTQRQGGVQVTIGDVRKNNAIWEIHMRLKLDEDNDSLQSHRGWVFQNLSYLEGKDGQPIDNAGLETTRQTPNEVAIAYLFDLPDGIEGLVWVYETPAAIVELPIEYQLNEIELP